MKIRPKAIKQNVFKIYHSDVAAKKSIDPETLTFEWDAASPLKVAPDSSSDEPVFLVIGSSGSGKSLFLRDLCCALSTSSIEDELPSEVQ